MKDPASAGGKVKAASKTEMVSWISTAFDYITANPVMIIKSFRVCSINSTVSEGFDANKTSYDDRE